MERLVYALAGVLTLMLLAGGLTQLTWSHNWARLVGELVRPPSESPEPVQTPLPTPASTPTPTPAATAPPTATPTPVVRTARAVSYVRIRQGPSVSTAVVGELQAGYVVNLGAYSDTQWQEATYNGVHGYVFKAYLAY